MKRKVVQIAGFTKVVSLPSEWVKRNKINKGDDLDIREEGDSLVISHDDNSKKEKAVLDLSKTDQFLKRFITIYYRLGYEELDVTVPEEYFISLIQQNVSQRLLGFEIVEQKKNFCRIRSISKGIEEEFDVILRRIFMMLVSMSKEGLEIIKRKEYDKLQSLIALEGVNNKFTNFCQRNLNKHGYMDHKKTTIVYFVVTVLEEIADAFAEIFRTIERTGNKDLDPRIFEMYKILDPMLYNFYMLFYDYKIERLIEFDSKWKMLMGKSNTWFKATKTPEEAYIIYNMYEIGRNLNHLSETSY